MIQVKCIEKHYIEADNKKRTLFESATVDFSNHRSVCIMGRSGSGKTTLLNIFSGLDTDYQGTLILDGKEMKKSKNEMANYRLKNIGIVSQGYQLLTDRTVLENVALALYCIKIRGETARKSAMNALSTVGISHLANKYPQNISGGEAQRVAIARALVKKPRLILADEPTGALDEATERIVLDLFRRITDECNLVLVTHSAEVASICDAVYHIRNRNIELDLTIGH